MKTRKADHRGGLALSPDPTPRQDSPRGDSARQRPVSRGERWRTALSCEPSPQGKGCGSQSRGSGEPSTAEDRRVRCLSATTRDYRTVAGLTSSLPRVLTARGLRRIAVRQVPGSLSLEGRTPPLEAGEWRHPDRRGPERPRVRGLRQPCTRPGCRPSRGRGCIVPGILSEPMHSPKRAGDDAA